MSSVHKLLSLETLWWLDSMISAAAGRPNTSGGFNTSSALMGLAAGAIGGAVLGELAIDTLDAIMSLEFVLQHTCPSTHKIALLPVVCPSMTIPSESTHACNHDVELKRTSTDKHECGVQITWCLVTIITIRVGMGVAE